MARPKKIRVETSDEMDEELVSRPRRGRRPAAQMMDGDDLPPDEIEEEAESLDADKLAAEVEQSEAKSSAEDESADDAAAVLPSAAADEPIDAADVDTVLPSMEGMSILRETELNDVIQDVKRRSEANGGYITYEELNQILPSNIVDAIQSDKYLKFVFASGGDFDLQTASPALVVQCGGCMLTRREVLRRIARAREGDAAGVAIVNYGLVLAKAAGVDVARCVGAGGVKKG